MQFRKIQKEVVSVITKNVGFVDRVVRFLIALVLLYFAATITNVIWIIALALISGLVIHTAITGY